MATLSQKPKADRASAWFARTARPAILAASRSHRLRHTAERMPVARDVVRRFVPGETVDDALDAVTVLRESDRLVSIDYLGEDVTDVDTAEATVTAYLRLLDPAGGRPPSGRVVAAGPTATVAGLVTLAGD